jgi:squalene synthase HpnC
MLADVPARPAAPAPATAASPTVTPAVRAAALPPASAAERAENFPVALRLLPRAVRADLRAVYDVVRLVDDTGDDPGATPEERTARLEALAAELADLWAGRPVATPALARLAPTVAARGLPRQPFDDLVAANLQDQRVTRYPDRAALLGYCALSAAPIGRLVLALAGAPTDAARLAASDRVCAALQLLEHWQDVAEDRRAGRVYLPQDAMAAAGVAEADLDAAVAGPALRRLVLDETARAAELLESGAGVAHGLTGWARLAVAGYLAGGRATVAALRRAGGEVLAATPRPRRRDVLRHLLTTLATGGRR